MARLRRRRRRVRRARPDGPPARHRRRLRAGPRRLGRRRRLAPRTSTRFPSRTSPSCRAIPSSSASRRRSSGGTRSRSSSRRTRSRRSSAGTSRATSRPRRSTRSASTTSGAARSDEHLGDLVYIQGHSSPGIYARAFLEGRLSEEQLRRFRQEVDGRRALVVSASVADAGLLAVPDRLDGARPADGDLPGALHEVPRRRAGSSDAGDRKVWAFMGDGEMDEPESMGAISLAGRERLDNLVFVVNCNLQRLDGPVRGNGKIIQELETNFRGAGWNVIKVIWGSNWDPLIAADEERVAPPPDGGGRRRRVPDLQGERRRVRPRALLRQVPGDAAMVADWTDEEIWALRRGGHDPKKVYAAYDAAVRHTGQPTVILAKTIKGYGMGVAGEGRNITHQQKAMNDEARLAIRDRLGLHLTDEEATGAFFHRPDESSPELRYLMERRAALGGSLPARHADERAAADARPVHERARGERRARELDDDGLRPRPQRARPRQGARAADRPDRARRVTDVRHGGDVPPARHLLAGRPALPARGRRGPHVLPRGPARPDPPGGDQRARARSRPGSRPRRRTRTTARR